MRMECLRDFTVVFKAVFRNFADTTMRKVIHCEVLTVEYVPTTNSAPVLPPHFGSNAVIRS